MSRTYKLKYKLSIENDSQGYKREDAKNDEDGLCDALVFMSILYPEDGSYSFEAHSADGRSGKQLDAIDLFRAWSILGMSLSENPDLKGWQKQVTEVHASLMRDAIKEISERMKDAN